MLTDWEQQEVKEVLAMLLKISNQLQTLIDYQIPLIEYQIPPGQQKK